MRNNGRNEDRGGQGPHHRGHGDLGVYSKYNQKLVEDLSWGVIRSGLHILINTSNSSGVQDCVQARLKQEANSLAWSM